MTGVILLSLRLALAAVFASAAASKLGDLAGFRTVLLGFAMPLRTAGRLAVVLPAVELAVAAGLVVARAAPGASIAAASLLVLFTAVVAAALAGGRRPSCGCFGGGRAVGVRTLVRNVTLLAAAVAVALGGSPGGGPLAVEFAAAFAIVVGTFSVASYRALLRRGEALLGQDVLEEATGQAESMAAAIGVASAAALLAAGTAAARPEDDVEALRQLLSRESPRLIASAVQTRRRISAQGGRPDREARRAARSALERQRRQLLTLRADVLALSIEDARAENARRLVSESLALFASSVGKVEASVGARPKLARSFVKESRGLLQEAVYRGSRAGVLLEP